jgi:bifunctional ADP-heptose synthase (sugar kinase/adenylyltransferase)
VLAIANHVAGFCDNVGLISTLGADNASHEFARKSLLPNVAATFLSQSQRPTITKLRYVEQYNLQKLFELYSIVDDPLEADDDAALCATLLNEVPKYDLVIVADYGHGMISSKAIRVLCDNAKFLAVNTQANAGNRGFHTISRYPRADYISLSELELNLEMKTRDVVAQELIAELKKKMEFGRITVTRGKNGILTYDHALGFAEGPGLAQKVVDRIGSGDAVLSVTSPIAFLGASPELIAFIGNVVGSEAVAIVGHRTTLEANSIRRVISSLLK